ncbi:hypothetical protein niasHT_022434 [Heterodera trifolii]|uniref:Uncharacterized protein n=1 Tax=Heterodera trifolii TaxID=157864 RepID=A0ABD2K8P8_9BILA
MNLTVIAISDQLTRHPLANCDTNFFSVSFHGCGGQRWTIFTRRVTAPPTAWDVCGARPFAALLLPQGPPIWALSTTAFKRCPISEHLLIALISALDSAVVRQQRATNADASKPEPNNQKPGTVDSDKGNADKSQGADTDGKNPEKPKESQEVEEDGPNPKEPTKSQKLEEDGPNPKEPTKSQEVEEDGPNPKEPTKSQEVEEDGPNPKEPTKSQKVEEDGPNPKEPTESQEVEEDGTNSDEDELTERQEAEVDRMRVRAGATSMHGLDKLAPTPPPSATSTNAIAIREKRVPWLALAGLAIPIGEIVIPFVTNKLCEHRTQYCPCGRGRCVPVTTYKADKCCDSNFEWKCCPDEPTTPAPQLEKCVPVRYYWDWICLGFYEHNEILASSTKCKKWYEQSFTCMIVKQLHPEQSPKDSVTVGSEGAAAIHNDNHTENTNNWARICKRDEYCACGHAKCVQVERGWIGSRCCPPAFEYQCCVEEVYDTKERGVMHCKVAQKMHFGTEKIIEMKSTLCEPYSLFCYMAHCHKTSDPMISYTEWGCKRHNDECGVELRLQSWLAVAMVNQIGAKFSEFNCSACQYGEKYQPMSNVNMTIEELPKKSFPMELSCITNDRCYPTFMIRQRTLDSGRAGTAKSKQGFQIRLGQGEYPTKCIRQTFCPKESFNPSDYIIHGFFKEFNKHGSVFLVDYVRNPTNEFCSH